MDAKLTTTRRAFLGQATMAAVIGAGAGVVAASRAAPIETTHVRLVHDPSICVSPAYLAEGLLRSEGFTDIDYVEATDGLGARLLAARKADIMLEFAGVFLRAIDEGGEIVILGGVHLGCFEVFGSNAVKSISGLKGARVGILGDGSPEHLFLSSVLSYVGLDPRRDIRWEMNPPETSIELFSQGKLDAFAGFPPVPQQLRAQGIGHVLLDTTADRPWSQHFCCMIGANRDYVRKHPIATKQVVRAILKGADICSAEPEVAANYIVSRGYTGEPVYALESLRQIRYTRWRDQDPEDTARFYALRLYESGMIKSSPNRLIAQGTNWRFFNEARAELKT